MILRTIDELGANQASGAAANALTYLQLHLCTMINENSHRISHIHDQ